MAVASPPEPSPSSDGVSGVLRRAIAVDALSATRETEVRLAPTAEERARLAAALDLVSLDALELSGAIRRWRRAGWRFEGQLTASLAQRCVVTLDPVTQQVDDGVVRIWAAHDDADAPIEALVDPEAEDESPEPLGAEIDIGAVAEEALALALDPYPRVDGAELESSLVGPPGTTPMSDEDAKPFAALSALKKAMTDEGGGDG